jgi:long-chain acyl-CoA synthetase
LAPHKKDIIRLDQADTLGGVLAERVRRCPEAIAYLNYDRANGVWEETTWRAFAAEAGRWQEALRREGLEPGDRVALMMGNRREWALFDLAAQGLGLVTVPLFPNDRAENIGYLLKDSGTKLLVVEGEAQWRALEPIAQTLSHLQRILTLQPGATGLHQEARDLEPLPVALWLPQEAPTYAALPIDSDALATIVYTSGTTGRPKGVMLSHRNLLWDIGAMLECVEISRDDRFLSFLPLSHTLERTCGFYLPLVVGASVAFARSIPELPADLLDRRPTVLVSVPRIFERVYARIEDKLATESATLRALFRLTLSIGKLRFAQEQGRAGWDWRLLLWPLLDRLVARKVRERFGGHLRIAVSGGAPLSPTIAGTFLGLGVPILQGYGLTEASPVVSANTPQDNLPASIGRPLPGVEVRIGTSDELLVRAPSVMLGYWGLPAATAEAIDGEGWLHTGDQARLQDGRLFLTGRIKEVIVLSTGEKVAPADLETAIALDGLFSQVMVIGEGRPFLAALVTLDPEHYARLSAMHADLSGELARDRAGACLQRILLGRLAQCLHSFPGHAKIHRVRVIDLPWSIESGMMTATMKLRRARILETYAAELEALYQDHK